MVNQLHNKRVNSNYDQNEIADSGYGSRFLSDFWEMQYASNERSSSSSSLIPCERLFSPCSQSSLVQSSPKIQSGKALNSSSSPLPLSVDRFSPLHNSQASRNANLVVSQSRPKNHPLLDSHGAENAKIQSSSETVTKTQASDLVLNHLNSLSSSTSAVLLHPRSGNAERPQISMPDSSKIFVQETEGAISKVTSSFLLDESVEHQVPQMGSTSDHSKGFVSPVSQNSSEPNILDSNVAKQFKRKATAVHVSSAPGPSWSSSNPFAILQEVDHMYASHEAINISHDAELMVGDQATTHLMEVQDNIDDVVSILRKHQISLLSKQSGQAKHSFAVSNEVQPDIQVQSGQDTLMGADTMVRKNDALIPVLTDPVEQPVRVEQFRLASRISPSIALAGADEGILPVEASAGQPLKMNLQMISLASKTGFPHGLNPEMVAFDAQKQPPSTYLLLVQWSSFRVMEHR
ncbi:hypothetical protein Nepgr_021070 [Nepenthes gracilis]|uniref:Uncharacterized protein n=1 Tax=Nepenthes gracilis TaxID=150966 RepID=A0AAD3XWW4_NEPGR|nr:hypothetical protein Nepgr_021070 [Nepenthes gracilis]